MHNFSFIDASETESSTGNEENKNPKVKFLKDFDLLDVREDFWHNFACHDALGDGGTEQIDGDADAGENPPFFAKQDLKLISVV